MFFFNAPITTRIMTPEGFMRVGATLTRTGIHRFRREELEGRINGLPDDQIITVNFTPESVFHEQTISSFRGVPVTLGHPDDGNRLVRPETWQQNSRGSVIGEPVPDRSTGLVNGEIFVGDSEAIAAVDQGRKELSIGYVMSLVKSSSGSAHFDTTGPIDMNHIAIVGSGRSGSSVRILNQDQGGNEPMSENDIKALATQLATSLVSSLQAANVTPAQNSQVDISKVITDGLTIGLKPLVEQVETLVSANAEQVTEQQKTEAKNAAKKSADKLVEQTLAKERARVAILNDASVLLSPEQVMQLQFASSKDILIAACANAIPNAADLSEEVLRGYLMAMAVNARQAPAGMHPLAAPTGMAPAAPPIPGANYAPAMRPTYIPAAHLPTPAVQVPPSASVQGAPPVAVSTGNEVEDAYQEMVTNLENSHLNGNPPVSPVGGE